MKKRWLATLSILLVGVIVTWGIGSRVWRSSEAIEFDDRFHVISDNQQVPGKSSAKTSAKLPSKTPTLDFDKPFTEPLPSLRSDNPGRPTAVAPPDGIESLAQSNPSDEEKAKLTALREKLAELAKAKGELINEATLTKEIATLEKQISDLHAAESLQKAKQILSELVEAFPESPAAIRAKRMLEAAEALKLLKPDGEPALPTSAF